MIRAIWFFLQIALIIGTALWIAERPGDIVIQWSEYTFTIRVGFFLLAIAATITLSLLLYKILENILAIPGFLFGLRQKSRTRKGQQALVRGFAAIAAGDSKKAAYYTRQIRQYSDNEHGLIVLLEAQSAKLRGDMMMAEQLFEKLMKDKDAAFFGIRGLLKSAIEDGENRRALGYAREALSLHPKQDWILKIVYDLEIQNHRWDAALDILKRAERHGAVSKEQAQADRIAILMYQSDQLYGQGNPGESLKLLEKAYRIDPLFVPLVVRMAERYLPKGKKRAVTKMVEKIWSANPHPDLLNIWARLAPANTKRDTTKRLRWYERLVALKPDSAAGQMAIAQAAMEDNLWNEATAYLKVAESLEPSAKLYRLFAQVEEQTSNDNEKIRAWLEKAAEAPAEKVWFCKDTNHIYERWSAIAQPHGSFNTIIWGYPGIEIAHVESDRLATGNDPLFLR